MRGYSRRELEETWTLDEIMQEVIMREAMEEASIPDDR